MLCLRCAIIGLTRASNVLLRIRGLRWIGAAVLARVAAVAVYPTAARQVCVKGCWYDQDAAAMRPADSSIEKASDGKRIGSAETGG